MLQSPLSIPCRLLFSALSLRAAEFYVPAFTKKRRMELPEWPTMEGFTPSTTLEPLNAEAARAELQIVLHSPVVIRSPSLANLLAYLCEKVLLR